MGRGSRVGVRCVGFPGTMSKKVVLQEVDGKNFEVDLEVAFMCETVKTLLPDEGEFDGADPIPLPAVKGEHLDLIITWCKHELENKDDKDADKKAWNENFFNDLDDATIFAIILGANYLDCKDLLKAGVYHVAGILHKLTPKQIWERYNPGKPLPTKEEIDNIFKDPQLEWAAMPDFSWGD